MRKEKEKIPLTIGKKDDIEIANWISVSKYTFSRNKEKYLKELEDFADFHIDKGKIVIDRVIDPYYEKISSKFLKEVIVKIDKVWGKEGLNTCSNVGTLLLEDYKSKNPNFSKSIASMIRFVTKGRDLLYGKPNSEEWGKIGKCNRRLCKYDKRNRKYLELTENDKEKIREIRKKHFKTAENLDIEIELMIRNKEITKEEAWDKYKKMISIDEEDRYYLFLIDVQKEIGYWLVNGTFVERKYIEAIKERDIKYACVSYYNYFNFENKKEISQS